MKNFFSYFGVAALVALATACGQAPQGAADEILIDSFSTKTNASFFQNVYSDIRVLPLDTGGEAMGGSLSLSLEEADGKYLVTDLGTGSIYAFGRDGSLLQRISKVGRGPGEYSNLHASTFVGDKTVVLADGGHIIEYDAQGEMVRDCTLDRELADIAIVAGKPVLLVSRVDGDPAAETDRILVCNASYQPESSFCPQGFQLFNFESNLTAVAGSKEKFLYVESLSTQLRKCSTDGVSFTYNLDFKGKGVPEAILESVDYEEILRVMEETPDMYLYFRAFENDDYLLLVLQHLVRSEDTEAATWLIDKDDWSSRIEYMDYKGDAFGFLGVPQSLTEQDEVVYAVDTEMLDAAVAAVPSLAAVKDSLPASFSGPALLVCKIK
ncbi:MAG: 6-bladed beta-propeller [Bacteroidales bacterium]|nr:6-bladed beta-propeller [Bacteroidales bacterium]